MKTRLLLFCLFTANLLSAQVEFAPIGAQWTYDYARFQERGRERIECVGDTVINGESARVLTITRTYIHLAQSEDTLVRIFENKYLRQSGDTVFLYHNDAFRLIYNFGAEAVSFDYVVWNDTTHYDFVIYTLAVADTLINGLNAMVYSTISSCGLIDAGYSKNVTLFEGIGALNSHLLYYSDYDCNFELIGNLQITQYHLRCYSVNGELMYASEPGIDCDMVTFLPTVCSCPGLEYRLGPNPARDAVAIWRGSDYDPDDRVAVYNANGIKMLDEQVRVFPEQVDLSKFAAGVYYFHFLTKNGSLYKALIVAR